MINTVKVILLLLTICFAFLSTPALANNDNLFLQHLSVKDGLSQASVQDVFQDREGFMWIGTENGVNIYDGYRFRVLPGPNENFENNGVYRITQDQEGLIWLIASHGLFTYNKKTDQYQHILEHAPEKKQYYFTDFIEDQEQTMWISSSKTVLRYEKKSGSYQTVVNLSDQLKGVDIIYQLAMAGNYLYLSTRVGIFVLDKQTFQLKKLPSVDQHSLVKNPDAKKTYNLYISKQNKLYLGTYAGIFSVDLNNIESVMSGDSELAEYQQIYENVVSWSFVAHDDALYVGSYTGLSKVDLTTNKHEQVLAFNDVFEDVNKNTISTIHVDQQGVFWLGSTVKGVYKWNPKLGLVNNLRYTKSNPNRLSDNVVWAIEKSKKDDNTLWVATENGLNEVNVQTGVTRRYIENKNPKSNFTESYIHLLQQDSLHRLWLLTAKGIKVFDTNTKELVEPNFSKTLLEDLTKNHYAIHIDKNDYVWLLSESSFRRINIKTGEVDNLAELEAILADIDVYNTLGYLPNSDEMLIASIDSLISFNTSTREAKTLYTLPGVVESDVSYIDSWVIDKENILWLAFSSQGLLGLDATTYQQKYFFTKQSHTIDHNIYGLNIDSEGDLWFSSHNGIYHLNRKNMHIRNFNVIDGFSAREFNGGAAKKVNESLFAYGSINGLSLFDPIKLKAKAYEDDIVVHVTSLDVLSRDVKLPFIFDGKKTVQLNYDDVGIRFDFSVLTFQHQDIMFSYKLMGKDNVSYPDTRDNFITFASLPSGKHTLSVRVRSPFTGEYSPETLIKINVGYAPWASPVAYFLYVLAAIIVFLWWLARKRRFTAQLMDAHERVKSREQTLSLALHGSNSSVWDWQVQGNMLFGKRASNELGYKNLSDHYCFEQHIELIHEQDREAFVHQWQTFIEGADIDDNFSCSYRLRAADGEWLWYKDLGKIVSVDNRGRPTRVTGSYTNITESRAQAERAQYYGEAFKQTKDWVLIISDNFTRVTVNNSLQEAFGWQDEEFSFDSNVFGLDGQRRNFYKKILLSLKEGEHWRGEELVKAKGGEDYHVIININVSMNQTTNSLHYVCIFTDITAQKHAEKELRYLANYDHLTGLPNRSLLLERIKHGMDFSKRVSQPIAIFFIDLDRFKQVNDSLGHDYGDMLLQEITSRLKAVLRVDDTVARLGGDEFVILLESFKGNSYLGKIAQKIIEVVGQPVELNQNIVSVGASIGIAVFPEDAGDSDELLKNADVAMYHAKQLGRNTFQFFTPRMNVEANNRLHAESTIKQAFENDEFVNHYQPIVDSVEGKAKGFELLLRWQKGDRLIMPGEFISIAEEIGLIVPMTEQALERGFSDLQHWLKVRKDLFLSVNMSAAHFSKANLVEYLTEILQRFEIPPHLLKLEITESTLIKEPEKVIARMTALTRLGVSIALDDFGTGFSSLNYLKQLPLNILKIDRSFVAGIGKDSADEAIVDATLVLANSLCMNCVAEGVETYEQLSYLAERNCYAIQGYLYSKPVAREMITQFLEEDAAEITI